MSTPPEVVVSAEDWLSTRSFVVGMMPVGGTLHADALYDIGAAAGFTVHQIRLCLARLVTEGSFTQEGRGRKAVFRETTNHRQKRGPDVEFLYFANLQDAGHAPWDHQWHLAEFTVEEDRRNLRNTIREFVISMGGALLTGGMYVQANPWEDEIREFSAAIGLRDRVTLATAHCLDIGGITGDKDIVAALWPLADLAAGYRAFLDRFGDAAVIDELTGNRAIAYAVTLIAAFEACIRPDPLLPPELIGEDWPGVHARDILRHVARRIETLRTDAGFPGVFARYESAFT